MNERTELMERLSERFPHSNVRNWSDGVVELTVNRTDMHKIHKIEGAELPGDWEITKVLFGTGGTSVEFKDGSD